MATRAAAPPPIAGSVGLIFGGLWACLAATGLPHGFQSAAEGVAVLITVGLIAVLWTRRASTGTPGGLFRRRSYLVAVGLEIVAICAASVLLPRYGLKDYLVQAVGVIVGLHFIGLWQATRSRTFLWIAGGMCCVSLISAFLPDAASGFDPRTAVSGFGNALVLWIGAGRTSKAE